MKFFIAAPWRNKAIVEGIDRRTRKAQLRGVFISPQSGANLTTGKSIVEELQTFSDAMQSWQDNQDIHRIFDAELAGLKESDVVVLLEPAGHSSLLEAGIGYGLGKKVIVVGVVEKPEVFYLISQKIYPDIPSFLNDIEQIVAK